SGELVLGHEMVDLREPIFPVALEGQRGGELIARNRFGLGVQRRERRVRVGRLKLVLAALQLEPGRDRSRGQVLLPCGLSDDIAFAILGLTALVYMARQFRLGAERLARTLGLARRWQSGALRMLGVAGIGRLGAPFKPRIVDDLREHVHGRRYASTEPRTA